MNLCVELVKIESRVGTPSNKITIPKQYKSKFIEKGYKKDTIEMTPRDYDNYQIEAGKLARQRIKYLILSSKYQNASDEEKRHLIRNAIEKIRINKKKSMSNTIIGNSLKELK